MSVSGLGCSLISGLVVKLSRTSLPGMPNVGIRRPSVHSLRYLPLLALGAYCTVPASMALRASCKA